MAKVGGANPTKTTATTVNQESAKAEEAKKLAETKQAEDTQKKIEEEKKTEEPKQEQQAPEAKKDTKVLEPKAWQRLDVSVPDKPKLVNQITFLGEQMDYEPGFKAEYDWNNLNNADGLKRVVTAKFPKGNGVPEEHEAIDFMGYHLELDKFGNSVVCKLSGPFEGKEDVVILEYVSLATVLDVLQDLLNPKGDDGKGKCDIPWGTIDQIIKKKRGLKSRIKNLGDDDLPARRNRNKTEETPETPETTENKELETAGK